MNIDLYPYAKKEISNNKKRNSKKDILFRDLTQSEIEEWEKKANGIVLFDDEYGISFQKAQDEDGDYLFVIKSDSTNYMFFTDITAIALKQYLNDNF